MDNLKAFYQKYQLPILVGAASAVSLAVGIKLGKRSVNPHAMLNTFMSEGLIELTPLGMETIERMDAAHAALAVEASE